MHLKKNNGNSHNDNDDKTCATMYECDDETNDMVRSRWSDADADTEKGMATAPPKTLTTTTALHLTLSMMTRMTSHCDPIVFSVNLQSFVEGRH